MEMSASTLPTEEGNASSDPSALSQGYVEHQRERIKLSFKQESTARAPVCESEKEGHMEVEKGSLDQLRMLSQQRRSVDALIPSAERSTGAECNAAASKEPKTGGMVVERENELEKFLSFGSPKRRELTNHKEDFSFVHPSSAPPTGSPSFAQKGDRVSSQKSNLTIPPETPQVSSLLKGGTDPPETSQVFRQTKLAEEKQSVGSAENLEMLKRDLGFDDSQDKSRAGEPEFALPSAARVTNREDIPAQEVVTETMVEIADVRVEKHAAADVTQRQQAKPETLHRSILARVCAWSAWSACCGRVQPAGAVPPAVRALFDDVTGGEAYATVEDLQVFVTTTQMGPLGKKNGGSHVHQVRKERVHLRK